MMGSAELSKFAAYWWHRQPLSVPSMAVRVPECMVCACRYCCRCLLMVSMLSAGHAVVSLVMACQHLFCGRFPKAARRKVWALSCYLHVAQLAAAARYCLGLSLIACGDHASLRGLPMRMWSWTAAAGRAFLLKYPDAEYSLLNWKNFAALMGLKMWATACSCASALLAVCAHTRLAHFQRRVCQEGRDADPLAAFLVCAVLCLDATQ
jgi:hypothetical protein